MQLITVKQLSFGYEGKKLITDLSFQIEEGSYLCIVGENGTGKSTLMKTLLQLLPQISGEIQLENGLKRNEIGYLPQQTQIQRDFPASVREVVLSGCQAKMGLMPFYRRREHKRARQAMQEMGISDLAHKCYRELSGGQQQRVLLARALCATGKILFLDEPVTGLDPRATEEMYELIKSLNEKKITIVMISHDVESSMKYASHVLQIGETCFYGKKEDYLASEFGKDYLQKGDKTHE